VHIWRQIRPATKLTRMLSIDDLFKGRHFDQEIIILCVRWYLRRLTSAAHEDVARTAVQKTQPTFEQQWVEVMLTSSTAERSTLCADYEIGLQLEPQEVRPSVRYGALRTGHPGHMSFGQTWSATASAWRRPQLDIARQALLNPAGTRSTLSEWIF